VGEDAHHLFKAASFWRLGSRMIAQVAFHHAIDGLGLCSLGVRLALLRSTQFFSHAATITRGRRFGTGSTTSYFDQGAHLQPCSGDAMILVGVLSNVNHDRATEHAPNLLKD
jgi:hypothetical protein